MEANVSVVFYYTISEKSLYSKVLWLYRLLSGRCCKYEHCSVVIKFITGEEIMYHVGTNIESRWIKAKVLKNFEPAEVIDLGTTDVDVLEVKAIGPIKFQLWVYFLWYLFIRRFSKWEPVNNCSTKSCEILNILGYQVKPTCVPVWLYDRLMKGEYNADNNDSG
jgi:hypothetical protein